MQANRWLLSLAFLPLLALAGGIAEQRSAAAETASAPAQPETADVGPPTLEALLSSSARYSPQILEGLARVRSAESRRLSAEGAFDTVFSAEATSRPSGYYEGAALDGKVSRPIADWGGQFYSGYRISRGTFPIYEDSAYTNQAGSVRVGAIFSLLRDRLIDDRRFGRMAADAEIAIADAERQMIAIGVQRRALDAYANWIATAQRQTIHRNMVALAEERQQGLRRSVDDGLRPTIILVENEQMLLRRRSMLVQAEQSLAMAANTLSLYWRDEQGVPRSASQIPPPAQLPQINGTLVSGQRMRPDLLAAELRERLVRGRLALERNTLLPRLDFEVEGSRDLGDQGRGGISRSGNDLKVGLRFAIPLQQRSARGRIAQTEAEIDSAHLRAQWLNDQIGAEIRELEISQDALENMVTLSQEEKARADTMAQAERHRFTMGASDLFLVNTREEAAANAALALVEMQLRRLSIRADFLAASGDARGLGLK